MPSLPLLRPVAKVSPTPPRRIPLPVARAIVDCGVYVDGVRLPGKYTHKAALDEVRKIGRGFVWVGLHAPDEGQMIEVADTFGLHPLAVEDAVHAHQRPKLERYDDTLVLVLKTVIFVEHESIAAAKEIVETGEIMIFVGPEFVVTVRHGEHSGLSGVRHEMDHTPELLALGPSAVLHAIADHVVDSYVSVTEAVEADIDAMEEEVFSPRSKLEIEHIYLLKREVVELRRSINPLCTALHRLSTDRDDLIPKEVRRYIRDVEDHHTAAAERVAGFDEVLSSLVDAALAKVTLQQNTDMRKITAWVAIVAVPTMMAGIYGMNFDNMPELRWKYGYFLVLLIMVTACSTLFRVFRKNRWL